MRSKTRLSLWIVALTVLGGGIRPTQADTVVYATASSNSGNSILGTLDLTTGQFTQIAQLNDLYQSLASGPGGALYGSGAANTLVTISTTGTETPFGSVNVGGGGFWGMVAGSNGFYGIDESTATTSLDHVTADGNLLTPVGALPDDEFDSGSLAKGPDGALYINGYDSNTGTLLFWRVNPADASLTPIGSGLATSSADDLTLVTAGGKLYGIDTLASGPDPIHIYTIDTTTGVAADTGVTVSGLGSGYTLDTAAAVPEPSSLVLAAIGAAVGLGFRRRRRPAS